MVQIWKTSDIDDESTFAAIVNIDEIHELDIGFFGCEPIGEVFPPTTLNIRTSHPPDDFFLAGIGMPVVSDRLRSALESLRVHAEFLPLEVIYKGLPYSDRLYYFMNILVLADVLDRALGSYTYMDVPEYADHVERIQKLAIDEKKALAYTLFRIAKGGEALIGVSDALAQRVSSQGFSGLRFVRPEEWKLC